MLDGSDSKSKTPVLDSQIVALKLTTVLTEIQERIHHRSDHSQSPHDSEEHLRDPITVRIQQLSSHRRWKNEQQASWTDHFTRH